MNVRGLAIRATGGFAVVGAVALAASLVAPALLDNAGIVLIPSGFVIGMTGIAYLTVLRIAFGPNVRGARVTAPPPTLMGPLLAAALLAILAGGLGLMRTDGFSADSSPLKACPWTISTDRGSRVLCVSHQRWLEVNEGVAMGLLGFLVVFCAVACVLFSINRDLRSAQSP